MSQPDSRRHHYVPAGYIGFFAEPPRRDGRLHVWDNTQNKGWIWTPDKVAFVEDLYRLDPGESPHAVEDALRVSEREMIGNIRQIEANRLKQPTASQVESVVSFVSLQYVRDPETHDTFDRFCGDISLGILRRITDTPEIYAQQIQKIFGGKLDLPGYEEARKAFRTPEMKLKTNNGYIVRTILRLQNTVFRILAGMQFAFFWIGDGEELVTASMPVVLIPASGRPAHLPISVGIAEVVVMPLTPKLLFVARRRGYDGIIAAPAPPGLANAVNGLLVRQSEQIYSRTPFAFEEPPNMTSTP